MGLPWDYHTKCKIDLEERYLLDFLTHGLSLAAQSAPAALAGADGGACVASLQLLSAALTWNYTPPGLTTPSAAWADMQRPGDVTLHVRPPPAWRDVLVVSEEKIFSWLPPLVAGLRQQGPKMVSSSLLGQSVRQCIVHLCSMTGDIFVKESVANERLALLAGRTGGTTTIGSATPPASGTKGRHLAFMLSLLLPELLPPQTAATRAVDCDEGILDTCRALLAASAALRLPAFLQAAACTDLLPGGPSFLFTTLSDFSVACMGYGESLGAEEAADMLIEMWAEFCVDPCRGAALSSNSTADSATLMLVSNAAANIFIATMRRELRRAAQSAWEDEEEYEGGEGAHSAAWLDSLSAIGRAACVFVLPALKQQLQECQAAWQQCVAQGQDPSAVLEQLCWVVTVCGHVMADCGDGETPLMPIAIADALCSSGSGSSSCNGEEDPVVSLSQQLLGLAALCQRHEVQAMVSPRLMEEVCSALGRWAETYLMMTPPTMMTTTARTTGIASKGSLAGVLGAYSDPGKAGEVSEGLVRLAMAALTRYPGDKSLHRAVCMRLLGPLVRRPKVAAIVIRCPAWQELCTATATRAEGVQVLEAGVQRRLMQWILLAAAGTHNADQAGEYAASLLRPLAHGIQSLSGQPPGVLQQADKVQEALVCVQSLRGAVRGTHPLSHPAIYHSIESVQPALLHMLGPYQSQPLVYGQILKLAADVVEYLASLLHPASARSLFHWAVQLITAYASHRTSASSSAVDLQLEDERRAVCALLRLLTQLTNVEASDEGDVASAVFSGLDLIMQFSITNEHLKFPKLRKAFFGLVAHMIEAHAGRVADLPPRTFSALISALCFGMGVHEDTETESAVFEAATALAKHHVMAVRHGAPGLGSHNTAPAPGEPTALGSVLLALLRRVLIDDPGFEAVDYAAEAALPLWLAEEQGAAGAALHALGGMLVAGGGDGALASATTSFQELGKAAHAAAGMDRASRRQFGVAFRRFVLDVRGVVRTR